MEFVIDNSLYENVSHYDVLSSRTSKNQKVKPKETRPVNSASIGTPEYITSVDDAVIPLSIQRQIISSLKTKPAKRRFWGDSCLGQWTESNSVPTEGLYPPDISSYTKNCLAKPVNSGYQFGLSKLYAISTSPFCCYVYKGVWVSVRLNMEGAFSYEQEDVAYYTLKFKRKKAADENQEVIDWVSSHLEYIANPSELVWNLIAQENKEIFYECQFTLKADSQKIKDYSVILSFFVPDHWGLANNSIVSHLSKSVVFEPYNKPINLNKIRNLANPSTNCRTSNGLTPYQYVLLLAHFYPFFYDSPLSGYYSKHFMRPYFESLYESLSKQNPGFRYLGLFGYAFTKDQILKCLYDYYSGSAFCLENNEVDSRQILNQTRAWFKTRYLDTFINVEHNSLLRNSPIVPDNDPDVVMICSSSKDAKYSAYSISNPSNGSQFFVDTSSIGSKEDLSNSICNVLNNIDRFFDYIDTKYFRSIVHSIFSSVNSMSKSELIYLYAYIKVNSRLNCFVTFWRKLISSSFIIWNMWKDIPVDVLYSKHDDIFICTKLVSHLDSLNYIYNNKSYINCLDHSEPWLKSILDKHRIDFKNYQHNVDYIYSYVLDSSFKWISSYINPVTYMNWYKSSGSQELNDTMSMLDSCIELDLFGQADKIINPKIGITKLHDYLQTLLIEHSKTNGSNTYCTLLPTDLIPSEINVTLPGFDRRSDQVKECEWCVFQPATDLQMKLWSSLTNNCVGTSSFYKEGIMKHKNFIVFITIDSKPRFTVQMSLQQQMLKVIQIKDWANQRLTEAQTQIFSKSFAKVLEIATAMPRTKELQVA